MEKKLTPIGELLEWINFIEHTYGGDGVLHIKTKATELLEEEKHEIIEAYKSGNALACDCYDAATNEDAIKYITDTYETK